MKTFAIALIIGIAGAPLFGADAERLINISGAYSDAGMTIRATGGAPSRYVSLCLLLSLDLSPEGHKVMAEWNRRATVTQTGDLAVEFVMDHGKLPQGSTPGTCHGTWTKADGLRVDESALTIPRGPGVSKGWRARYRFSLDREGRLILTIEFIPANSRSQAMTAVYAFPRLAD